MELYDELICKELGEFIVKKVFDGKFNVKKTVQTKAINALNEIRAAIQNHELSDFEAMEEILCIFEKYGIRAAGRHDCR